MTLGGPSVNAARNRKSHRLQGQHTGTARGRCGEVPLMMDELIPTPSLTQASAR